MLENGYIKLYRSFASWRWYDDWKTRSVFLHLLISANIDEVDWHGAKIKRGQRVCSRKTLSDELNMSEQNIRTALEHLKLTGEITVKSTSQYSVITVTNYDKYQGIPDAATDDRQSGNNQPTNVQPRYKKDEESSKKEKEKSGAPAQYSPEEWEALKARLRR